MMEVLHELKVRKIDWVCADTFMEAETVVSPQARKVAALVVLPNPALQAASDAEGLRLLAETAAAVGEAIMPRLLGLLEAAADSYGKAAVVGTDGQLEHAAALLHPTLGKPMRAVIGGGSALIPSNVKVAAPGTAIDVPLGHCNDSWSFDEMDTITVGVSDAPRPAEVVLVLALACGGRPRARVRKP